MKRREHDIENSSAIATVLAIHGARHPARAMLEAQIGAGESITVQAWYLGVHRPSDVGLYDTVRLDPDGTVTRVRPIFELNSGGAKCVVGYEED